MKMMLPKAEHEALRKDFIAVLDKYTGKLDAIEMLAIGAHLIGQLAAMQDQRKFTSAMVMEVIVQNIQQGNSEVVQNLHNSKGNA